ncbi:MAG TPA: RidA family protein [Bellilinea sp.]|nr:RidA family protein [Bellilinea sp.]
MASTSKTCVKSDKTPAAIGPYSIAVKANGFVFTSGQVGIDPRTNELAVGGLEAETHQVFANLKLVLDAAGTDLSKVVKVTVFLKNMGDFAAMNAIYAQYFTGDFPARSAFQVAALPKGALIEIEAVAEQ